MDSKILFSEKQKFTQWWLWLLLWGMNSIFLYGIYQQVLLGIPYGDHPMSNAGLWLTFGLMLLLSLLFWIAKLETNITKECIYVRLFPFQIKYRSILWSNVHKAYIRTYSPIKEYGGWGIRVGLSENGQAYNVSGNVGLQIEYTNGNKLLIGTQKAAALEKVISTIL